MDEVLADGVETLQIAHEQLQEVVHDIEWDMQRLRSDMSTIRTLAEEALDTARLALAATGGADHAGHDRAS